MRIGIDIGDHIIQNRSRLHDAGPPDDEGNFQGRVIAVDIENIFCNGVVPYRLGGPFSLQSSVTKEITLITAE